MKRGISQEGLKAIACVCMLLDHIGAALVPDVGLRIVGRIAFPIYCFLLVEGMAHTRNRGRYALRLGIGAALSEVPFDLLFFGGLTWHHQSVMVTLLLGFGMLCWMRRTGWRVLPVVVCSFAAELLGTDYGGAGVMMIFLFAVTRELPYRLWIQTIALGILCALMDSFRVNVFGLRIPIEVFAVAAMLPIGFYSGRKATKSPALQWGFYLFYPVHLAALWLISLFF